MSEPTRHNSILPIPHFKDFHFGVWRLRKNGVNGSFAAVGGSVFSIKAADEDPIVRFHRSGLWLIPIGPKHDTLWFSGILFLEVVVDQVRSLGKYLISYRLLLMITTFRCTSSFPCL